MLDNLLSNAIKYSPQGGRVEVGVASEEGGVIVSIRDHGMGMKEVERERLFTRWSRGADVERIPGTGLGLSVVTELIRAHGGRVWVEDAAPGTKVPFSLPRSRSGRDAGEEAGVLRGDGPRAEVHRAGESSGEEHAVAARE